MTLVLKNLLFTVTVPRTVCVYVPLLLTQRLRATTGAALALAVGLFVIGSAIYAWTIWDLATFGRGTPASIDVPKRLVVRGLYRYTRNPMYAGVLTILLGWVVLLQALPLLIYAVVVGVCVHLVVVLHEERRLARQFGTECHRYRAAVGR